MEAHRQNKRTDIMGKTTSQHNERLAMGPPPSWRRSIKDDSLRRKEWSDATKDQRRGAWKIWNHMQRCLHQMTARLKINPDDTRAQSWMQRHNWWEAFRNRSPKEEAEFRYKQARIECNQMSERLLAFQQARIRGCTVIGCPLGIDVTPEPVFAMFEHDHVTPADKVKGVTRMHGSRREAEAEKTQVLCMWHHYLNTAKQQNHRHSIITKDSARTQLRAYKVLTRCEYPYHDEMPYSVLMKYPEIIGFLDVSHVRRSLTESTRQRSSAQTRMEDLKNGRAVIHCRMCHRMFTVCEQAMIHESPLSVHQYQRIAQQYPDFIRYFHEVTDGFDWVAYRTMIRTKQLTIQRPLSSASLASGACLIQVTSIGVDMPRSAVFSTPSNLHTMYNDRSSAVPRWIQRKINMAKRRRVRVLTVRSPERSNRV